MRPPKVDNAPVKQICPPCTITGGWRNIFLSRRATDSKTLDFIQETFSLMGYDSLPNMASPCTWTLNVSSNINILSGKVKTNDLDIQKSVDITGKKQDIPPILIGISMLV